MGLRAPWILILTLSLLLQTDRVWGGTCFVEVDQAMASEESVHAQAESTVANIRKNHDELYPTTGMISKAQTAKALQGLTGKAAKLRDTVANENLEVTIHLDKEAFEEFLRTGTLKNIHMLSDGHYRAGSRLREMQADRNAAEASMSGQDPARYRDSPGTAKPIYGVVQPAASTGLTPFHGAKHFGEYVIVLDLAKIRNRLTWTPGDSLARFGMLQHPVQEGTLRPAPPRRWDQAFIPWDDRTLMVPTLLTRSENGGGVSPHLSYGDFAVPTSYRNSPKGRKLGPPPKELAAQGHPAAKYSSPDELEGMGSWPKELNDFNYVEQSGLPYIEAQIWGGVTLGDVKEVYHGYPADPVFGPPTADPNIVEQANRRGLKIVSPPR